MLDSIGNVVLESFIRMNRQLTDALIKYINTNRHRVVDCVYVIRRRIEQPVLIQNALVYDTWVLVEAVVADVRHESVRRV